MKLFNKFKKTNPLPSIGSSSSNPLGGTSGGFPFGTAISSGSAGGMVYMTSGVVIPSFSNPNHRITTSIPVNLSSGRIEVSLEDLVQYGRQGYMVKIANLSVEDKRWLRDQLDTDSVDIA